MGFNIERKLNEALGIKLNAKQLQQELFDAIVDFAIRAYGYEREEAQDLVVVEIENHINDFGDKLVKVEIRNDMFGFYSVEESLIPTLNKIISRYDSEAFFEPYYDDLWEAYLWNVTPLEEKFNWKN